MGNLCECAPQAVNTTVFQSWYLLVKRTALVYKNVSNQFDTLATVSRISDNATFRKS